MQAGGRGTVRPPIGIAFEGDLGNRIDAVLAVAMLNGFSAKGEARRITLCVSRPSVKAAQVADVISAFYAGRVIAGPGGATGGNPDGLVGMPESGPADATPVLAAILTKKSADGTPLYASPISQLLDTADNAVLMRNMLLAQNDGNASVVIAGPATGAARLLGLYGAKPQIAVKVSQLVLAVGAFPTGQPDPALASDIASARALFASWPTPIVVVGTEVGDVLRYPGSSIESDFAWAPSHPVVDAYRAFKPMPYDAPAPALAAMLYAVHPEGGYFKRSEPGTISVLDDGRTRFTPAADGKHRYVIVDPAQRDRIIKLYRDMVSAMPAPRPSRGRGAAPAPVKPADVKPPTP